MSSRYFAHFIPEAAGLLSRNANDAPTTSESGTRNGTFGRTPTESVTVSDSAVAEINPATNVIRVTFAQAGVLYEPASATRMLRVTQAQAEVLYVPDITPERTTTDSITVSDSASATVSEPNPSRTASDSVSASESVVRTGTLLRTTSETSTVSESLTRQLGAPRSASEAVFLNDSADADITGALDRTTEEAISTSESAVRSVALSRSSSDSPTLSDSAAASVSGAGESAFQSGAFQASPAFQIEAPGVQRTATDSVTASDSATRAGGFTRATTEAPSVAESVTGYINLTQATTTDSVSVTDAATAAQTGYWRSVEDFPSETRVIDDFNRGSLGANWDPFLGNATITSNYLRVAAGQFDDLDWLGTEPPTDAEYVIVGFDFWVPNDPADGQHAYSVNVPFSGRFLFVDNEFDDDGNWGIYSGEHSFPIDVEADTWYSVKAYLGTDSGSDFKYKIWRQNDPEPTIWQEGTFVGSPPGTGGSDVFISASGSTFQSRMDNIYWQWSNVSDVATVIQDAYIRTVTDTLELEEWPSHLTTVATDVYGQDPTGYQPNLAAPIDDTQTTITVTEPLPPGTELPVLVYINGEYVLVTAVSLDGLTWTVVRGVNGSTAASHSTASILPANTTISVGGAQIGALVDFRRTRLSTHANGQVGTGEIWVRDIDRVLSFTTGAEVIVRHRNVRVWGGYIANVKRAYAFPGGTGFPDDEPRYLILEVVDYNILLRKRIYHDKDDPTHMKVHTWKNGTPDDIVIGALVSQHLNLRDDGVSYEIHHVGTPGLPVDSCNPDAPDRFQIAWAGYTWYDAMRAIADQTGAIFYIDPDKVFRYVDDSTKQSAFGYEGLTDDPSGLMLGYRDFELVHDGTKLVNEQFTWGVGQGATAPVLGHATAPVSIANHGLWQQAELRYDMYCQGTVDLRANTWLDGSPQNHRGYKEDLISVRATVFHPYFRVADVIELESTTFGFSDAIPVRGAEISFPTPWDIQCILTISHEYDAPWEAFEFFFPNFPDFFFGPIGFWDFIPSFPPDDECADNEPCLIDYESYGARFLPPGTDPDPPFGNTYIQDGQSVGTFAYLPEVTIPGGYSAPFGWTSGTSFDLGIGSSEPFSISGTLFTSSTWAGDPNTSWVFRRQITISSGLNTYMLATFVVDEISRAAGEMRMGVHGEDSADNPSATSGVGITSDVLLMTGNSVAWSVSWDGPGMPVEYTIGGISESRPASQFPNGVTGFAIQHQSLWFRTNYLIEANVPSFLTTASITGAGCDADDPCDQGGLADPIDDGALFGVSPNEGVELENGNFLYTFDQQFLPGSTEIWADGLRLRLTEDYDEHPFEAAIEIHADAQSGFTVFDPSMAIVANMIPFVTHDPPPEYVEP